VGRVLTLTKSKGSQLHNQTQCLGWTKNWGAMFHFGHITPFCLG